MRKYLLIFVSFLLMTTCVSPDIQKIGIIFSVGSEKHKWSSEELYFTNKIKSSGIEPIIEYSYPIDFYRKSLKLIDKKVKVLIIVSDYNQYLKQVVEMAHQKGIKIISYDKLTTTKADFYISYDAEEIGKQQIKHTTEQRLGNYILIGGPSEDKNSSLLKMGQMNELEPYINNNEVNIILDVNVNSYKRENSYILLKSFILKNPNIKIDAIITASDELTMGVIECLKDCKNNTDILIAGENADVNSYQRILDGTQFLSIYKKSDLMVEKAAEISIRMVNNIPTINTLTIGNTPAILFRTDVITRKNIDVRDLSQLISK